MRDYGLWLFHHLLGLGTFVSGAVFANYVFFGNGLLSYLFGLFFLFGFMSSVLWWREIIPNRVFVDKFFVVEQIVWHILLVASVFKAGFIFVDPSNVFVFVIVAVSVLGLRLGTLDSLLKQER